MSKHKTYFYTFVSLGAILILVILTMVAFAGGLAMAAYTDRPAQATDVAAVIELASTSLANPVLQSAEPLADFENALMAVYDTALPSVVDIEVTQKVALGIMNRFGSNQQEFVQQGEGSGFVWDQEGHIVTNYHVVAEAETVNVIFADGTTAEARVIGTETDADLAVLKVDLPASALHPLTLGDSSDLKVGQLTLAIGNPYGQDFSLTTGIVSAIDRTIPSGNSLYAISGMIQTDAAINPGNSGGPLLNRYGDVIGINTVILSASGSNAGIGFAVPINIAKQIVPTLIAGEDYEYSWLGISGETLTDDVADLMNLSPDTQGVLVTGVTENSPADQAGLQGSKEVTTIAGQRQPYGGDVITAINGEPVADMSDLLTYLVNNTRPGDQVTLSLLRADGESETVTVTLGARPES